MLQPGTAADSDLDRPHPLGQAPLDERAERLLLLDAPAEGERVAEEQDPRGAGGLRRAALRAAPAEGVHRDRHREVPIDVPDADARTEGEAERAVRAVRIEREALVPRALGPRRHQVEPRLQEPERDRARRHARAPGAPARPASDAVGPGSSSASARRRSGPDARLARRFRPGRR